jgi:hypothetical protein
MGVRLPYFKNKSCNMASMQTTRNIYSLPTKRVDEDHAESTFKCPNGHVCNFLSVENQP